MRKSLCFLAAAAVAGCASAEYADLPPERGITADIDATHQTISPLLHNGQIEHDEPAGAFPWTFRLPQQN